MSNYTAHFYCLQLQFEYLILSQYTLYIYILISRKKYNDLPWENWKFGGANIRELYREHPSIRVVWIEARKTKDKRSLSSITRLRRRVSGTRGIEPPRVDTLSIVCRSWMMNVKADLRDITREYTRIRFTNGRWCCNDVALLTLVRETRVIFVRD